MEAGLEPAGPWAPIAGSLHAARKHPYLGEVIA
jgi:hypothetical protein